MSRITQLYQQIKGGAANAGRAYAQFVPLLNEYKLELTKTQLSGGLDASTAAAAREVLEISVLAAAEARDFDALARNMVQLKDYYYDLGQQFALTPSANESLILGLDLLRLLSANALAEFHMELERIPFERHSHMHIAYPISLERYIMEGSYGKLRAACAGSAVPHPVYGVLTGKMLETLREEAAKSMELAYTSLGVQPATEMLMLSSVQETQAYIAKRGWGIHGDQIVFASGDQRGDKEYPARDVILNTVFYAKEMERIV
jgi:26S proteasome regulatory subunit N12